MITEKVDKLPFVPVVREQIVSAITARAEKAEMNDEQLDSILSGLGKSLQVFRRDGDGSFTTSLVQNGKIMKHDNGSQWSIADWVNDYVFDPDGDGERRESVSITGMKHGDLEDIATGKKTIAPVHNRVLTDAIPASDARRMSQNIEDIAKGKQVVDMSG